MITTDEQLILLGSNHLPIIHVIIRLNVLSHGLFSHILTICYVAASFLYQVYNIVIYCFNGQLKELLYSDLQHNCRQQLYARLCGRVVDGFAIVLSWLVLIALTWIQSSLVF